MNVRTPLVILAGSVLLVRRMWPVAVVLVFIAVAPAQMGYLMGLVGLYTLAASEAPRRIIGALSGMAFTGVFIVWFVQATQITRWTIGGEPASLAIRPLLPHESGCYRYGPPRWRPRGSGARRRPGPSATPSGS